MFQLWLLICQALALTAALENGLALTPPMGWMSWLRFGCDVDCDTHPRNCISEDLIKRTADRMVSDGYKDAGYEFIIIDDCWLEKQRGPDGCMVPDRRRFISGIKSLADYIHSKGLKFGMYQDIGTKTCQNYPGMEGSEQIDVDTFVEWDIDYLKVDGCYADNTTFDITYPELGNKLNFSGRPIVYSCSWPAYQTPLDSNYTAIAEHCNLWRNYDDIQISWKSVHNIMRWFGDQSGYLAKFAGPGHFNDPDMLVIGNQGVSEDQARAQMAVWAVLAGPLLMSIDLDSIEPAFKKILLNKDIIAVSQDRLGEAGRRVYDYDGLEVWNRRLQDKSFAVAVVNANTSVKHLLMNLEQMDLPEKNYTVTDLFNEEEPRVWQLGTKLKMTVRSTGVKFYKLKPNSSS